MVIRPDSDAGPARVLPGPGPDESLVVDPVVRRRRIASIVIGISVVLGLVIGGGRWLLSRSYFVGLDGQQVVIYQGVPAELGPLSLAWVVEETSLRIEDVPEFQRPLLEQGMAAINRGDARDQVDALREAGEAEGQAPTTDGASPSPEATHEPNPSPDPGP